MVPVPVWVTVPVWVPEVEVGGVVCMLVGMVTEYLRHIP